MPDLLGEYAAGQTKSADTLRDQSWDHVDGRAPTMDTREARDKGTHKSGYPTNAQCPADALSVLHLSAGLVILAALLLVAMGGIAFKGFNF